MFFCEAVVLFVNSSKGRSFSDAGNSGKHRKTRGFHGLARPKPAFRKGWHAKTRVLTRPAGEKHVKRHGFLRGGRVFPKDPIESEALRTQETRENIVKRMVFRGRGTRKHRKTRGFHGLARPKPAFRKGWRAKTRVLTRFLRYESEKLAF